MNDARPQPFPWSAALHFGLGLLRLGPRHFWAMTPAELMALAGGMQPVTALGRDRLAQLMAAWPDKET